MSFANTQSAIRSFFGCDTQDQLSVTSSGSTSQFVSMLSGTRICLSRQHNVDSAL